MRRKDALRIKRLRVSGYTYRQVAWVETGYENQLFGEDLVREAAATLKEKISNWDDYKWCELFLRDNYYGRND